MSKMVISRKQYLNKRQEEEHSNVTSVHQGLPDSMKSNSDDDIDIQEVEEVQEENYVEEINVPVKQAYSNLTAEQQEIKEMQMRLAQDIGNYNPTVLPPPPNYHISIDKAPQGINQQPINPEQYQTPYLQQQHIFQQPLPPNQLQQPLPPDPYQNYQYQPHIIQAQQQAPHPDAHPQVHPQYQQQVPQQYYQQQQQYPQYQQEYQQQQRQETSQPSGGLDIEAIVNSDDHLYIINITNQAILFTDLFGPGTKENECSLGVFDQYDPGRTGHPYMTIPKEKKKIAFEHDYFVSYLERGYIKMVSKKAFQEIRRKYDELLKQVEERRRRLEQIANQGGFQTDMNNVQQRYYQQISGARQSAFRPGEENVIGDGPNGAFGFLADGHGGGIINPHMAQVHQQFNISNNEDFLFI